jgi:predicted DNA-binding protein
MTGKTHQGSLGATDDTRLQDLLRADAAAVMDDDLDDETVDEGAQLRSGAEDDLAPATRQPRSQVYSIRVPVERLEQLRNLAKERTVAPTVMLREWVLTRLDSEIEARARASEQVLPAWTRIRANQSDSGEQWSSIMAEQETSTSALANTAAQLAKTVELFTQLIAAQIAATRSVPSSRKFSLQPGNFHAESLHALTVPVDSDRGWASLTPWPSSMFAMKVTVGQVDRGVAELRSTVQSVADSHGFTDDDLDTLYQAADEELSNP